MALAPAGWQRPDIRVQHRVRCCCHQELQPRAHSHAAAARAAGFPGAQRSRGHISQGSASCNHRAPACDCKAQDHDVGYGQRGTCRFVQQLSLPLYSITCPETTPSLAPLPRPPHCSLALPLLHIQEPEAEQLLQARVPIAAQRITQWVQRLSCLVVGPGLGDDPLVMATAAEVLR